MPNSSEKLRVYMDCEATGTDPTTALLNSVAIIKQGKELYVDECRLPVGTIPTAPALLVQGKTYAQLSDPKLPPRYAVMTKLAKTIDANPNVTFAGYNVGYDYTLIANNLAACGLPPWTLTQADRNVSCSRMLVMAAGLVNPKIRMGTKATGALDTTLAGISRANKLGEFDEHNCKGDAGQDETVEDLVFELEPQMKNVVAQFSNKHRAIKNVRTNDFFVYAQYTKEGLRPKIYTHICEHPEFGGHELAVDVDTDKDSRPLPYAAIASGKSTRVKKWAMNRGPVLLLSSNPMVDKVLPRKTISVATKVAQQYRADDKLLDAVVAGARKKMASYEPARYVEESLVSGGFLSLSDQRQLERFHNAPPQQKLEILIGVSDRRYREWLKRLILDTWPEALPPKVRATLLEQAWSRLTTDKTDVPWTTINSAKQEIEQLRTTNITKREHQILTEFEEVLMRLQASPAALTLARG